MAQERPASAYRRKKLGELRPIKSAFSPNSAADIESKRPDLGQSLADILRPQPARQKDRTATLLNDRAADRPVVRPARAAEFLDRQVRIPRVQEQRINLRRNPNHFRKRICASNVDDLDLLQRGQCATDLAMSPRFNLIDQLHG